MFKNYFLVALRNLDRQGMYSAINIMGLAVIAKPHLILADEPTGNLDSQNGQEVMDLLNKLNKLGTTILMVTHSRAQAEYARRDISRFDGEVLTENLKKL
jgi:putative ABC transport system ATP-binding protein